MIINKNKERYFDRIFSQAKKFLKGKNSNELYATSKKREMTPYEYYLITAKKKQLKADRKRKESSLFYRLLYEDIEAKEESH